ncbi:hypothetical protein SPBRAN_1133 [uncultured Candidatus Thioglobus sp.]|nr:hypothetical protein SPBRAN_1133 [uncultured Candidatus Thioglobus sp.]
MEFLETVAGVERRVNQGALGRIVHKKLEDVEVKALEEAGFHVTTPNLPVFPRYRKGSTVFFSAKPVIAPYARYAYIQVALAMKNVLGTSASFALLVVFQQQLFPYSSLLKKAKLSRNSLLNNDDYKASTTLKLFAFKVKKLSLSTRVIAVSPENILQKCIRIPVKYSFIVTLPNIIEHHW